MGRLKRFLYIGFIIILSGCALEAESPRQTAVQLKLNIPQRIAAHKATAAPTPSGIAVVTLDVTGPGMDAVSTAAAVSAGSAAVLEVSVPNGLQRNFTAKALDANGAALYQGATTVDLTGEPVTLSIAMAAIPVSVCVDVAFGGSGGVGPLTVVDLTPPDGAIGVSISTSVTAFLSGAVSPSSVNANTFIVSSGGPVSSGGTAVQGTFSFLASQASNAIVVFTPAASLSQGTTYTIELTSGIQNACGALTPFTGSFTTGSAPVGDPNTNLGFELGNFTGFSANGAAAVIQSQGSVAPPESANMAKIDTGAGASLDKSSAIVSGPINVPLGATQLTFDLNFLSDEYPNYIGQEFDDVVVATLIPGSGTAISKRVASVNSATFTDLRTDTTGIGFDGMTGFFPVTFDVSGAAGGTVILSIEISDVGDTAYDSAALIDNIRFNTTLLGQ